ncbi:MFS transporter [Clostridium tepidiprofundi]|nr:MFS transporter [Clostridium tepidiprofundi]
MNRANKIKQTFSWNFSMLIFGNSTSLLGSIIFNTILTWWLIETTNSAKALSYISAVSFIPIFAFNIFNGAIIDIFNRKKILVLTDLLSSFICIVTGYLIFKGIVNIPLLIIANFLLSTCSCLFDPTVRAILPEILKEDLIATGNSITTTTSQIIKIIAPLIAGFLLNNLSFGIAGAFFINGISFFYFST